MKIALAAATLVAVLALGPVYAAAASNHVVKAETKDAFDAVAADVRKEMAAGGRYAYVKPDEREKIDASLTEMGALFDANGSVDKMDKATKVKLFNAQEVVNSILTLRDRDRLICERGTATGSRIVSTSCRSYGDLEAMRQASQKLMDERVAKPCSSGPCKGE